MSSGRSKKVRLDPRDHCIDVSLPASLDEYNRAKNEQTANIVAKLGKKADSDTKTADKAEKEYSKSVDSLKSMQEKAFCHDLPSVLRVRELNCPS